MQSYAYTAPTIHFVCQQAVPVLRQHLLQRHRRLQSVQTREHTVLLLLLPVLLLLALLVLLVLKGGAVGQHVGQASSGKLCRGHGSGLPGRPGSHSDGVHLGATVASALDGRGDLQ